MQNFHCNICCVTRITAVLEEHVINAHIVQFKRQEIGYLWLVILAIDGYGLTNVIFQKL